LIGCARQADADTTEKPLRLHQPFRSLQTGIYVQATKKIQGIRPLARIDERRGRQLPLPTHAVASDGESGQFYKL